MPTRAEMLVNWPERRQEALGMTWRLETAHGPFALASRLMRILGAVIEASVSPMLNAGHNFVRCCLVAPELGSNQHTWDVLASLE